MRNHQPSGQRAAQTGALMAAVIGAASGPWTVPVDHDFVGKGPTCEQCTRPRSLHMDAQANSYQTEHRPGIVVDGVPDHPIITVRGANGRRILIADMPEGVYLGGVLIESADDLDALADLLRGLAERRRG